uniref:RHS repeat-associated core domain-containing protein n=1 Tax=Ulvibacterium sp. TaxID=2665914 RepID=UPI0026248C06
VGGTTTHYIRGAAGETIAVYENGSREFINLIGPGGDMIGTWDGSQRRYFLKDHLGSIRTTVDQSGNVDGYDDYYAFGLVMPGRSSNSANPADNYKFTGHELDQVAGTDLNLYHANARSYDPVTGRFLQIDPYAAKFPNVSPYVYALNNPLAFLDPDGRIPITFHIRSFAPFNYFGGLFHGDGANRGFSRSQSVTSRVKQSFTLETSTGGLSDISTTSDPSGHLVFYGNPTADPSGSVDVTRTNFTDDFNSIGVGAEYAGANPFIPGSPDIDVFSSLSIVEDTKNGTLTISGALTGDNFPSTEAFVQDASGASLFLGVGFYEGSPFSSLAGKNRRNIAEFNLTIHTNKDGNFTGVTFNDKRYTLEEWNSFFENANPHGN